MVDNLTLKWGTLKGWYIESKETFALLEKYFALGVKVSAMLQQDTPEQQSLLLKIIDQIDGSIYNDWEGKEMTKDEAKKYIIEYGRS